MAIDMAIGRKRRPRSYSIAEARDALARIVHDAEQGRAIELTRRGRPVAAIVSVGDLQRLRGEHTAVWDMLVEFRAKADLGGLWAEGDPFGDVRDRSPGRKVRL